jgi:hypothetical protein
MKRNNTPTPSLTKTLKKPNADNPDNANNTLFHKGFKMGNNNPIPITPRNGTPKQKQLHLVAQQSIFPQNNLTTDNNNNANANVSALKKVSHKINSDRTPEESFSDASNESANATALPPFGVEPPRKSLKPSSSKLPPNSTLKHADLTPELECLCNLILLQHEAFAPYLIELGNTNLTFSKQIKKKKENYDLLKSN